MDGIRVACVATKPESSNRTNLAVSVALSAHALFRECVRVMYRAPALYLVANKKQGVARFRNFGRM